MMKKRPDLRDTFVGTLAKLNSKPVGGKQKLNDIQLPDGQMSNALAQSDSNQMPWSDGKRVNDFKSGNTNPSS